MITEQTHFTERSSSLINIILVSNPSSCILSGVGDPLLNQEIRFHCPVFIVFKFLKPHKKLIKRHVWKYKDGDYENLKEKFRNSDWESLVNEDIDVYATNVTDHILQMSSECIPNKYANIRPSETPWMHNELRKLMRKRKRAYDKAKQTKLAHHWDKYKKLRNDTTTLLRSSKKSYFDKLANKLKSNHNISSKDWWKTLKTFISTQDKSSIPPLKSTICTDDIEKANPLNMHFKTQSDLNDTGKEIPHITQSNPNNLTQLQTSPMEVKSILETLQTGKASGPDNINNYVLKSCSSVLSYPLSTLFNLSLSSSKVPQAWKEANVTPVFEKDDPSDFKNYRPISLLSTLGKVMEKIVHKHVFYFLNANSVITSLQSGFVPGDSTVNQLVYIYNTFSKALDDGLEVKAIFCDISKAFYRVWQKGLLLKLQSVGLTGPLLEWCATGLYIGTTLISHFINVIVIVKEIHSIIRLFADDTSLYIIVDSPDNASNTLNQDLAKISSLADRWLVLFNPKKTESILFSRLDRKSLDIIYTFFIRPILEYADIVWCNLTKYQEDELEKIQIEAARIVTGATKLVSHDNLYRETCLETLNPRRKQHKLTLYYKMINF